MFCELQIKYNKRNPSPNVTKDIDAKKRKFIERKWKRLDEDMKNIIITVETATQNKKIKNLYKEDLNEHKIKLNFQNLNNEPDNIQIDDSDNNWTEICDEIYSKLKALPP